jgi:outer membrane protein, heavy metal efflux system
LTLELSMYSPLRRAVAAAYIGGWALFGAGVIRSAQTQAAATDLLTLREAITATLATNPGLALYPFRAAAIAGQRQTANLAPPLQVNGAIEDALGSGALNFMDAAEFTLTLSQVVELGGQRAARVGVANRKVEVVQAEQRITELDLLAEVTRRFIATAAAQAALELQQRATTLAQQTLTALQPLVTAGQTPAAELLRATAAVERAKLDTAQAVTVLEAARISLASMWASQMPDFAAVGANLLDAGEAGDLVNLLLAVEANPDILLFASQERLLEAQVHEALSEQRGTVQWTAGIRHLREAGDTGFVVGASRPLGSRERASGAITAAEANFGEVAGRRAIALNQLRTQLYSLHLQLQQAILEVNSLRSAVLPPLNTALEQTRAAYLSGRYSYLELVSAQAETLNAERSLINAATAAHLLRVEIERLSGGALSSATLETQP